MKTLTRLMAFRALSPDTGAEGGAPTSEAPPADVVQDTAPKSLSEIVDAAVDAAADEETDEETEDKEKPKEAEKVADADPAPTDEPNPADAPPATDDGDIPAEIAEKYPAVQIFQKIEAGLMNPETAPETLQRFAQTIADSHGMTVAEMLGLSDKAPEAKATDGEPDWKGLGFDSKEEYDLAPDWQQAGFDSPGEYKLFQKVEALEAELKPIRTDRETQAKEKAATESETRWVNAIQSIAPKAIDAVKAETGWEATPELALAAARRFPQLASQPGGLAEAIIAANARTIAQVTKTTAKNEKPVPPEMPEGAHRPGKKVREFTGISDLPGLVDDLVAAG